MKKTIKLASVLLALVMIFSVMTTNVWAEDEPTLPGTITISNAARGVEYSAYKLFDATVDPNNGAIVYSGEIPTELSNVFKTDDTNGTIVVSDSAKDANGDLTVAAVSALQAWADKQSEATATAIGAGSAVELKVPYGYYVVKTTQGTAVSVTSTNPTATIVDKNTTEPSVGKKVDDDNVYIGQTVTYTVTATTANYDGEDQITNYIIEDTLPAFLSNPTVTSITIGGADYKVNGAVPQFDNKKIIIPWVGKDDNASLYENGAVIVITYTATVTDEAAVDGDGNTNTVTLSWTDKSYPTPENPDPDKKEAEETIYTYAIALKKVNKDGKALAGATFKFPFYVKSTVDANDGAYIYAGKEAGEGLTNELTTPADGVIIVKGLESGEEISITEVTAPDGYNKLTAPVTVTPVQTKKITTNTTIYLDADGNVVTTETEDTTTVTVESNKIAATAIAVLNNAGSLLPSTGGIGTTIFYVVGAVLVLGAVVLLVTKRRAGNKG